MAAKQGLRFTLMDGDKFSLVINDGAPIKATLRVVGGAAPVLIMDEDNDLRATNNLHIDHLHAIHLRFG